MIHKHWKSLFRSHIWQRGVEYYLEGRVSNPVFDGSTVTADVEGTDIYTVSVTLNPETNDIIDYFCDCPYGEDGTPCKHLAAVLNELGELPPGKVSIPKNNLSIDNLSIGVMVNLLSEEQLRELLTELARKDSSVREKIKLAVTQMSQGMNNKRWEYELNKITDMATDSYGNIDYDDAYDYCMDLTEYLEDRIPSLIAAELIDDAFELTCLVFQTALEQDLDDSDGGLSVLFDSCTDTWSKLLNMSDINTHREMFRWFTSHFSDYPLSETFLEEYIFDAPWNDELAPEILRLLDLRIQRCLNNNFSEYYLNELISRRIKWMYKAGIGKSEIDSYITKYYHLPAVRDIFVSQAIQNGDYTTALAVLEEGKELDKDKTGVVAEHSSKKIGIYELTGDVSALRDELEYYVFEFRQDNLNYVNKLKELLSLSEWSNMRDLLLSSGSMESQIYPLLEQEGMYGEMMRRIELKSDLYALERYEDALKSKYILRCINVYVSYLHMSMREATGRKAYWSVIQVLKKLCEYPDGKWFAQEVADTWKQNYPRRSSMLDELRKAGF